MSSAQQPPVRLYSLDVLRGFAALAIVFWHWQHFFYFEGRPVPSFSISQEPLYSIFFIGYHNGGCAVDLFFILSGFIFYWLYSGQIARRGTSAGKFFVRRFSRLYPLHLLTLLAVAVLQFAYGRVAHTYFVYPCNDTYHFVLNLLCASSWGFEKGYSFNAPFWVVSVEILMYGLFFIMCRLLPVRIMVVLITSLIGFVAAKKGFPHVGRGLGSFFLGGCVYFTYAWLVRTGCGRRVLRWLLPAAAALWIVTSVGIWRDWTLGTQRMDDYFASLFPAAVLFPLTILTLALMETERGPLGRRVSVLGDISYSTFLIHFPLQLFFVTIAGWIGLERSIFYSPYMLFVFFAVLLTLSFASFRCVERPAQQYIRSRVLNPGP
jgi:peptidoglycan/LPS O-acetylase OafA/YrhL